MNSCPMLAWFSMQAVTMHDGFMPAAAPEEIRPASDSSLGRDDAWPA